MNNPIAVSHIERNPERLGQTVVVIGGSAGIGLETARRASAEGAKVILTGRSPERLQRAASEVHALSTSAFDATDPALLEQFFRDLPTSIDHHGDRWPTFLRPPHRPGLRPRTPCSERAFFAIHRSRPERS